MARPKMIPVRVTEEEKTAIEANAAACSQGASTYLRALGLHTPIQSTLDHEAVLALLRLNADQGRLGGLLKLWLTDEEKARGMVRDVRALLHQIEAAQREIRSVLKGLPG